MSPKLAAPRKIGLHFMSMVDYSFGYLSLLLRSLRRLHCLNIRPVRRVFYKQVYFTGMETLGMISAIAALLGFVIVTEVTNLAGAGSGLMGKIMVWTVVREIGPLFSAIVIIARSGTAVASELGSMKVGGEVDSLKLCGIDPRDYLIVPRVAGIILSVVVLTFYFQVMAVGGGLLLSSLFFVNVSFEQHIGEVMSTLTIFEIWVSLLKTLIFGMIISTVVCFQGLSARRSITEIPQAAARAVMQSFMLVIIFDGVITFAAYL